MALLLPLLNTVVIMGALGLLVYTQLIFKRPQITETSERARLAKTKSLPVPLPTPITVDFETVTVNIEAAPAHLRGGEQGNSAATMGKIHYVNVGFALELRDMRDKDLLEDLKPRLMDKVLSMVGKKSLVELNTVQGRYVLRTQIMDMANNIATGESSKKAAPREPFVTNVYFTQFVVQ